jgi:hypothetical protein
MVQTVREGGRRSKRAAISAAFCVDIGASSFKDCAGCHRACCPRAGISHAATRDGNACEHGDSVYPVALAMFEMKRK